MSLLFEYLKVALVAVAATVLLTIDVGIILAHHSLLVTELCCIGALPPLIALMWVTEQFSVRDQAELRDELYNLKE